jgi:septation ring formation regulator EzrA
MIRTQITLDEDQHRFLKKRAYETGMSLSALIRQAVNELRTREARNQQRAMELLGAFESDREDVAEKHDDYFPGGFQ